jgi:hypothetical protein
VCNSTDIMSYAIETKKRKFDRILEALTDGAVSPSRSSLNSRNNASTTTLSQDSASDSSKRRRVAPGAAPLVSTPLVNSVSGHYLPSSRTAFLQRLETFRHVTQWHIPSTEPINAAAWAKRGWICADTDTVCCGVCKARARIDLELDNDLLQPEKEEDTTRDEQDAAADEDDRFAVAAEIHDNMVKRYQDMIVTAHADGCLWRKRGCDASIQRIEGLLNTASAMAGLRARYDSIMTRPEEVPEVSPLPSSFGVGTQELTRFQLKDGEDVNADALTLAICGWERKCEDVVECRHCFRSLGLWLYRGGSPSMEKLDAVESHLEYCPWRAAEAQDTEVMVASGLLETKDDSRPRSERLAGWLLVSLAVVKESSKKRGSRPTQTAISDHGSATDSKESLTPEQREKKMRDLLRRIKEIKKPFNVKSLLKRKDKDKTNV